MLKILLKDYKDKVKRLLSVMLPIIGTQIAIMGMNFFDASMSGQAGDAAPAGAAPGPPPPPPPPSAVIFGCRCRPALQAFCWRRRL